MESQGFQVKSIPRSTFFDIYDELSHREGYNNTKSTIVKSASHFHSSVPFIQTSSSGKTLLPNHRTSIPLLNLGIKSDLGINSNLASSTLGNPRTRPPCQLVAIEIPLKPEEINIEFSSSRDSPNFKRESSRPASAYSKQAYSNTSEISANSLSLLKVPASAQSKQPYMHSATSQKVQEYLNKLQHLDSSCSGQKAFDRVPEASDELSTVLQECKVVEFSELVDSLLSECYRKYKKSGGCLVNCSRKERIKEDKKLEYFYHFIGTETFDITKLIHRNILRKYIECICGPEIIPRVSEWEGIGFGQAHEEFFQRPGAPLGLILGIYVVISVSKPFLQKILQSDVCLLDVVMEISSEAYKLSTLAKMKKLHFMHNPVGNYFKLSAASIISWFILKFSTDADSYELTQQILEKMQESSMILIASLETPILAKGRQP